MADFSFDQNITGSLTSDVVLGGLDDMNLDLTLDGGTTTTLAGGTTSTIHSDATVTLEPVTTNSTVTLEPVTTDSTVDLKPVAVDTCFRLEFAPPPPTEVHTPYDQRWALSLWGQELVALSVCGQTSTEIRPAARRPVVLGREDRGSGCGCGDHPHDHQHEHGSAPFVIEL